MTWTGAIRPEPSVEQPTYGDANATNGTTTNSTSQGITASVDPVEAPTSHRSPRSGPLETDEGDRRRQSLPWQHLLRRVFSVDVSVCPVCYGPLTVISYLTDPQVVTKILNHLRLPAAPPPLPIGENVL